MRETVDEVQKYIREEKFLHLVGVNADKINEIEKNVELKRIVVESEIINADGASLIIASKILKKPLKERVAGIDLMEELLKFSNQNELKIYLLGAKEETIIKTKNVISEKYPDLHIVGYRNGYFDDKDFDEIKEEIIRSNAHLVFIGITSPKKEYIIDKFRSEGLKKVFMGVGGSFDVFSGEIPRAPLWLQNLNLEWLFRVINEPKRLFKRYFFGNLKFITKIFAEKRKMNRA